MSDYDQSFGCLGTIISAALLIFLWPYIVAAISIYFAYILFLELLAWVALNWVLVSVCLIAILTFYMVIRYKLARRIYAQIAAKRIRTSFESTALPLVASSVISSALERSSIFKPSTDLYCYWCTKKLGLQSWQRAGKFYCQSCYESICKGEKL